MKIELKPLLLKCFTISLALSFFISCSDKNKLKFSDVKEEKTEIKGDVFIYATNTNRTLDFKKDSIDFSKEQISSNIIYIDASQRYQTMDGFGAAITGSTAYNLLKMTKEDRTKFLTETFSVSEGLGFSYVRIAIGCSDFSLSEYSCCDKEGIQNFALTSEENNYVIPILKEILVINPELKIMGSPWTCPRWMKVNNLTELKPYDSWTNGHLNPAYYSDYGTYFVKWIKEFASVGIPIYSITPQNEPLNRGNSASLYMGWEEQRDFLKNGLIPKMKDAGLKTKIYIFDHNYNYDNIAGQDSYPVKIYDSKVDNMVVGAAFHNYGGRKEELLNVYNKYPKKELVFTEASIGTWNDGQNLSVRLMKDMEEVALGTVNNRCKAVIVWNLMLDTNRGPNRDGGCQTCYGAVDIDRSNYKDITKNSHYYIIGHLSSVVRQGATRIGSRGYVPADITYSAFENTDGTYSLVLLNNSNEKQLLTFDDARNRFSYEIPSNSVVSLLWKK